ncbi:MAG: hypothetical protein ACI4W7_01745 [Candidatus Spyradenecus sp.]
MKATLAMIACLAMAGFLTAAATVEGNNTAVVIQKDKIQASTGWQFLCVPVDGLAINGTEGTGIDISTFLPPASYSASTEVYVLNADGTKSTTHTFMLTDGAWAAGTGTSDMVESTTVLKPGAVLWVLDGDNVQIAAEGEEESASATPITFCGQSRTRTAPTRPTEAKKMTAMKNDGATPITLSAVVSDTPQNGDQVLLIVDGRNDYQRYYYLSGHWWDGNTTLSDDKAIQPGESFYYYSRN